MNMVRLITDVALEQAHMIVLGQWNEERGDVICFSLPLICSHILHIHCIFRSVALISAELRNQSPQRWSFPH